MHKDEVDAAKELKSVDKYFRLYQLNDYEYLANMGFPKLVFQIIKKFQDLRSPNCLDDNCFVDQGQVWNSANCRNDFENIVLPPYENRLIYWGIYGGKLREISADICNYFNDEYEWERNNL